MRNHDTNLEQFSPKEKEKVDGTSRRNVEQTPSSQENGQKEEDTENYFDFLPNQKNTTTNLVRILTRTKQEAPCEIKINWDDFQQVEGNQKDLLDSDAKGKFSPPQRA